MPEKNKKPALQGAFNASVVYQMHSNPPIFGLHSNELGYAEIRLKDLKLTAAEIDVLCEAKNVAGTYVTRAKPVKIYHPVEGIKKSAWKVTSLKPSN